MGKISREEFESFKKDIRKQVENTNEKIQETNDLLYSDYKEVSDILKRQGARLKKVELTTDKLEKTVNILQPRADELRKAHDTSHRISKELEEQTVRNIELRTKANTLNQDNKRLRDENAELSKKQSLREKKRH